MYILTGACQIVGNAHDGEGERYTGSDELCSGAANHVSLPAQKLGNILNSYTVLIDDVKKEVVRCGVNSAQNNNYIWVQKVATKHYVWTKTALAC